MDYLIDVLVNGSRAEVEEANRYINLIHNRMGGIQNPVEVDVNFKEGEARRLQPGQDPAVLEAQMNAENDPIESDLEENGLTYTAEQDALAMKGQEEEAYLAAVDNQEEQTSDETAENTENTTDEETDEDAAAVSSSSSTFSDLTSESALRARQIYTSQKLESMKQAAISRLKKAKGVRVYFRNNLPDAIDIDSDVLFNGFKFRPEALPVLDDVYTLMALTQGAGYIILPPGSYTDNITLAGIRQAMALNSFLVHKGLSSGRLSYNMGLFDQEPPAKFANLDGVSIVFDFDAELPASIAQAASVNKLPMLSMAVVPVSNKIDVSVGEAFAIDFSVIETASPIENWLFQVVQHAANGGYYVVRQLEGFAPVYHQLVWNGRKGIIGPELSCGTYTLALTAKDVDGGKRTIRRQIEVVCSAEKTAEKNGQKNVVSSSDKALNYKTARLWTKPARIMKSAPAEQEPATPEPEVVDPFNSPALDQQPVDNLAGTSAGPAAGQTGGVQDPYADQGVNNPYDMPYDVQ